MLFSTTFASLLLISSAMAAETTFKAWAGKGCKNSAFYTKKIYVGGQSGCNNLPGSTAAFSYKTSPVSDSEGCVVAAYSGKNCSGNRIATRPLTGNHCETLPTKFKSFAINC